MRLLTPSHSESITLTDQEIVDQAAQNIPEFNPADLADGRKKQLQAVAVRQGQAKFREKLLDAYNSRCAVTGTAIAATLQAAHIVPYRGPETNSVQNGVLLRADIHNLFDLGLIQINPSTLRISLSEELKSTSYGKLDGRKLKAPLQVSKRPRSGGQTY
jgi:predicted restriction endonuclease